MLVSYELRKLFARRITLVILAGLLLLNGGLILRQAYEPYDDSDTVTPITVSAFYRDHADATAEEIVAEAEEWEAERSALYWFDENGVFHWPSQEQVDALLTYTSSLEEESALYQLITTQVAQVTGYEDYLETIRQDSIRLTHSTLFAQPGTFSYRNILRTETAYADRFGTVVVVADSNGVKLALEPMITTVCLLFAVVLVGFNLSIPEREEGLYPLIRPTRRGFTATILAKLGCLALVLLVLTLLFYGTNLAISGVLFGFGDLSRSIQSLYGYSGCPLGLTVGAYLALFLAAKYAAVLVIGTLFFGICLGAKRYVAAGLLSALVFLVEAALYWGISLHSVFSPLRQLNLVALLDTTYFFDDYRNMNLFTWPVNIILGDLIAGAVLLAISARFCWHNWVKSTPVPAIKSNRHLLGGKIGSVHLFSQECYKLFLNQKGVVILVLFLLLQVYSYQGSKFPVTKVEYYYTQYAQELAGEITPEKEAFVAEELAYFDSIGEQISAIMQQQEDGEISSDYGNYLISKLQPETEKEMAFYRVLTQWTYLEEQLDQGVPVRFIPDTGYRYLLEDGQTTDVMDVGKLDFVLVLGLAAVFPNEYTTHMVSIIAPSVRGKKWVRRQKLLAAALYTLIAWLISVLPRLITVLRGCELSDWTAAARSLTWFSGAPKGFSVLAAMLLFYLLRLIAALLFAGGTLWVGNRTRHVSATLTIQLVLAEHPVALYLLGVAGQWGILGLQTGALYLS